MTSWGFTEENSNIIVNAYKQIGEIYSKIAFMSMDEIRRIHPKYWQQYRSLEEEIDVNGHEMATTGFETCCNKMIDVWNKIAAERLKEYEFLISIGETPSFKHVDYSLSFVKDEKTDVIPVGYVTLSEIRDYFDNKISIKQLQDRNVTYYDSVANRRKSNEALIGPIGLSNDGTGDLNFKWNNIKKEPEFIPVKQEIQSFLLPLDIEEKIEVAKDIPMLCLD